MQESVAVFQDAEQASAALHPLRRRLLESFREPSSTAEVARLLGLPRQRIGHHVRLLRERGLLNEVGERRKGAFVESLLQTPARAYVVAPQALGELAPDPAQVRDRFSSEYLTAAASQTIRDLTEVRQLADREGARVPTVTLETEVRFASPADQAAFGSELTTLLADLVARYHDEVAPKGLRFRVLAAAHPRAPAGGGVAADRTEAASRSSDAHEPVPPRPGERQ